MKKLIAMLLALSMLLSLMSVTVMATGAEDDIVASDATVVETSTEPEATEPEATESEASEPEATEPESNAVCKIVETGIEYETLTAAVAAANASEGADTIELLKDIDFDSAKALSITGAITITGDYTISRGAYTGTMFTVPAGASLTLDKVTIDGNNNWTFDADRFKADAIAGKTVNGETTNYHALEEGAPVATASMFTISGSVTMNNGATIQNNAGAALFTVNKGGYLETNNALITRNYRGNVEAVASIASGGRWVINKGTELSKNFSRNGNGGLCRVYGTVIINDGLFTQNAAIGNGSIFMVYTAGSYLEMNDGLFTENYCLNHNNNNWNGVIHVHYTGGTTFVMNGGEISGNYGSYCGGLSASKGGTPASITINSGKIVDNVSALNGRDVTLGQNITIAGDSTFGEVKAYRDVTVKAGATMTVEDTLYLWKNGANIVYTGEGTVDGNVYLYNGVDATMSSGSWVNGRVTVNAIGTETTLIVKPNSVIDGVQVRVLNSVASGDYTNADEAAAAQAAAYVAEDGAIVKSPVLYYHRLTSAQKQAVVVTFDYNGGLDAQGWSGSQLTAAEAFAPALPAPTKEGYKLVGWKYAVDNNPECLTMEGAEDYAGEAIAQSVRLIAQWEEPDYVCYIKETGVYYETLTAAVNDANASEGADTIVMIKDIDFDSSTALSITGDVTIISEPEHETPHVISRGAYTGTLFTVPAGSSLTLDGGIILDGSNDWIFDKELYEYDLYNRGNNAMSAYAYSAEGGTCGTAAVIVVNGTVNAKNTTIRNFFNTKDSNGGDGAIFKVNANAVLDMDGATISRAATYGANAVAHLAAGSKWYIKGDTLITDCWGGRNGGICRNDSGVIYMSGGTIQNTAGKNVNGTVFMMYGKGSALYMTGGTICGNSSVFGANNGRCAAVYLHSQSYMKMTGGTICHNVGGSRGGIDSYSTSSVLDINRVDQPIDPECGVAAYTASNHPMIVDNVSLIGYTSHDVGHSNNFDTWWVTGGIYTQDVDDFCAEGYVCIPYEDSERTDDYIVVPGYRVKYHAVETVEKTDAETGEVTTEIVTTLLKKEFHLLPRDKFWYEMDERAAYYELTDENGGIIKTWYTEKELVNVYDFANTKLESDLDVYGEFKYTTEAAVVLTIDMSGTMYRYKMSGTRYVDVAKAKALDFVNQYASKVNNEGDKRMLAIASFDTDAKVVLNWVDVNTPEGLAAAKKAINAMKVADNGSTSSNQVCTNFDGGVILTRNLLKQSAVSEIGNKFAIILSDGAPTVTVNSDSTTVGTIKSSFWGNQLDASGKKYQNARCGGGWTHPAEVAKTLSYLATGSDNLAALTSSYGDNKEGIFIVGVGGDMSVKLFNDAVYGTSNGSRTSDVKKKPAAFNNVEALQGYTQAEIMAMTTGQWLDNLATKVGGTYVSAANAAALQNEFNVILDHIVNS